MSAVRKWTLFLRAVVVAVVALVLGVGAFRVGVITDPRLALWPTFELLRLERLQADQPLSTLAFPAAAQVTIWTLLAYLLFLGFDVFRHSGSRRP